MEGKCKAWAMRWILTEGEETEEEGLRDQVDGVAGSGEVQLAGSLVIVQVGGLHSRKIIS